MNKFSKKQNNLLGELAAKLWLKSKMEATKIGISVETYTEVNELVQKLKKQSNFKSILMQCIELIKERNETVQDEKSLRELITKIITN
ncbi:MAG: hypothetical protein ICV65_03915 [Flavisolibacter sp.]|nr:hypothetical protein [Flavisolibacter sp.]